jgi:zinc protease
MKRLPLLALCLAAVAGRAAAAAAALPPPVDYQARVLANGLKVYTVLDRTRPKVSVQLWYGAGARNDPVGRAGLAHLVEHLMFKGRGEVPEGFLDQVTESAGGDSNAATNHDFAQYYDTVPPERVEPVLWAEAARMKRLELTQADLDSERAVVERELLEAAADRPHGGSLLAWDLPKGGMQIPLEPDSTIGTIEELQRVTLGDVQRFHDRYYGPDNAALVIVGAFDPSRLSGWVDRYFGGIPRRPASPAANSPSPPTARASAARRPAHGRTAAVVLGFAAPPAGSADAAALSVLDQLLTGSDEARGYTRLVDRGVAADVFSQVDLRQDAGAFIFGAVCGHGGCDDRVGQGLRQVLAELRNRPVPAAQLDAAKNQLLLGALEARETAAGLGAEIGRAVTVEGDASHVNTDLSALQRVTPLDVQRVARRYLADDKSIFVRLRGDRRPPQTAPGVAAQISAPQAAAARPSSPAPPARLAVTVARGAVVGASAPKPEEKVLANGLRVVVVRTGHLPLATATLIMRVAGGPAGRGATRMNRLAAEAALFGCGPSVDVVASRYDALGLSASVHLDSDAARLSLSGLSASMPDGVRLLARCVRSAPPSGARFKTLRRDLAASEAQPDADVDALADVALDRLAFGRNDVRHPPRGSAGRAALLRARNRLVRPDGATLVLTGDVDPAAAFRLAETTFGGWSAARRSAAPPPTALPAARRLLVVNAPGYPLALIAIGARTPGHSADAHLAFALADSALGGSFTSRLSEALRTRRSLTYDVSSQIDWRREAGLFSARTEVDPAAAPEVARLMVGAVDELARGGPDAEELARAKALVSSELADAPETTSGLADLLAEQAARGEPLDHAFADSARLPAIGARDVQAAAARLADSRNLRIVIVADVQRLPADFRRRLAPAAVVQADALVAPGK